jgi:CHASE2 domain-containing sensor protein
MPIRTLKPEYVVEITAPKHGSAYRIGGRLVLTCAHLFDKGDNYCKVRSKESFKEVEAKVVWRATNADVALVELPKQIKSCKPVAFGRFPARETAQTFSFDLCGFPEWGSTKYENGTRKSGRRHIKGTISLADTSPDGLLVLQPRRTPAIVGRKESNWQGMSGGAVVCAGLVVAVQQWHQRADQPAALEAALLENIYEDQDWRECLKKHHINLKPESLDDQRVDKITSFIAMLIAFSVVTSIRSLGFLQPLELKALDHLFSWQLLSAWLLRQGTDEHISIITIDDEDIQYQKSMREYEKMTGSLSDKALLKILQEIRSYNPKVIASDIVHDVAYSSELKQELDKMDNFVATCVIRSENSGEDAVSEIDSPPDFAEQKQGFSNFPDDWDHVVRRQVFGMLPGDGCKASSSLAFQIAARYLNESPQLDKADKTQIKIKGSTFNFLRHDSGGYKLDEETNKSSEILINYRPFNPTQIKLRDVLAGNDQQLGEKIKDKAILIGGIGRATSTVHHTPYTTWQNEAQTPAVFIHAQMANQIISSVLGERPIMWWLPEWAEYVGIVILSIVENLIFLTQPIFKRRLFYSSAFIVIIYILCLWVFQSGGWMPLVPCVLAVGLSRMLHFILRKKKLGKTNF